MERMKKFFKYALIIAAFWIFSDIIIYLSINSAYTSVDAKIYTNSPEIIVEESKATYVNGYIKGRIKNNSIDIINNKYLKIDLYSARDIKLGTKYIQIKDLEAGKYQDFNIGYKLTDVDYANIVVTDNVDNASEEEFLSQETTIFLILGTLMVLYFI